MNTARKGNAGETKMVAWLEKMGYVVGSRRHLAGPGDLLAYRGYPKVALLVEVKARKNLWEGFRRADRQEMLACADENGLLPVVAWWKPRAKEPELLYGPHDWP